MYQFNFQDHICLTILVPTQLRKIITTYFLFSLKANKKSYCQRRKDAITKLKFF